MNVKPARSRFWLAAGLLVCGAWQARRVLAQDNTLCAVVRLVIEQEATLEREAFDAKLVLTNNLPAASLTDLKVTVSVTDIDGAPKDGLFFIKVAEMKGTGAVDGTGVVQPASEAAIRWLIIPSTGAGGTNPTGQRYAVTAAISYSANGTVQNTPTYPAFITVKPQPVLRLEYVLPFEVFGDEPLTGTLEPIEPFPLGVRVSNVGHGVARNFSIDSGQPKIVDNQLGLLVDFKLIGTMLAGKTVPNTLLIPFGDIAAGAAKTAAWQMTSTLSGRFVEFTASFTHAAELGGQLTSLIQEIKTYTLVKDVLVDLPGRDQSFDFLVSTRTPRGEMKALLDSGAAIPPDMIIESDQTSPIAVVDVPASLQGTLSGASPSLVLALSGGVGAGQWIFASVPSPLPKGLTLESVRRADGKTLHASNAWVSKHFNVGTRQLSYRVNLLDLSSGATAYTLNFSTSGIDQAPAAVDDLTVTAARGGALDLGWTAPGEDGDVGDIVGGRYLIQRAIDPAATFVPEDAQTSFSTAAAAGSSQAYALGGLIGNATHFLRLWTQDTGGNISGISNGATAYVLPLPPTGLILTAASTSSLAVAWQGGNNSIPIEYQVGLATAPGPAPLQASPFKDSFDRAQDFTGLAPNTTHYFSGLARNPETDARSETAELGAFATLAAPSPGRGALEVFAASATLSWLAGANPPGTEYWVEISSVAPAGPAAQSSGWIAATAHAFTGLQAETLYFARVKARNMAGVETAFTDLSTLRTVPPRPDSVTDLAARSGDRDGEVALAWTSPGDLPRFRVRYSTSESVSFEAALVEVLVDTPAAAGASVGRLVAGLNPGTTYFFAVAGEDDAGQLGLWLSSAAAARARDLPPGAPADASAGDIGVDHVTVRWSTPAVTGTDDLDLYRVYRATYPFLDAGEPGVTPIYPHAVHPAASLTYYRQGLTPNTTFYWRVGALDTGDTRGRQFRYWRVSEGTAGGYAYALDQLFRTDFDFKALYYPDSLYVNPAAPPEAPVLYYDQTGASTSAYIYAGTYGYYSVVETSGPAAAGLDGAVLAGPLSEAAVGVTAAAAPVAAAFAAHYTSATARWQGAGNPEETQYLAQLSTAADFGGAVLETGWAAGREAAFTSLTPAATYYARVKARNWAGVETAFVSLGGGALARDDQSPELSVEEPRDGTILRSSEAVVVVRFADADSGVDLSRLAVSVDGATVAARVFASSAVYALSGLSSGRHRIEAAVFDLVGNAAAASAGFAVNAAPEPPLLLAPAPDAAVAQLQPPLSWAVPADGDGDALHFIVELATTPDFASAETFRSSTGAAGFSAGLPAAASSATASFTPAAALAQGDYYWRAAADDGIETGAFSAARLLRVDATAPLVAISSPAAGARFIARRDLIVIGAAASDARDPAPTLALTLAQTEDRGSPRGARADAVAVSTGQVLEPFDLDDGLWELRAAVTDWAGNVSTASVALEVVHDVRAPRTSLAAGEPSAQSGGVTAVSGATLLSLTSFDDLSSEGDGLGLGVAQQTVSVDGVLRSSAANANPASGAAFSSSFTLAGDADGLHLLAYSARDVLGNEEAVRVTTVAVDNTAPLTSLAFQGGRQASAGAGSFYASSDTRIALPAEDPVIAGAASGLAQTRYALDGGAFSVYAATFALSEGIRRVDFQSVDNLGHVEPLKSATVYVDATAPMTTLSVSTPSAGGYVSAAARFALTAEDPVVGGAASGVAAVRYRVNGGDFAAGPLDFALSGADGPYALEYHSQDHVGNLEVARSTAVILDQTAPVTTVSVGASSFTASEGTLYVDPAAPVALAAADVGAGVAFIEASVDGAPFTAYAAPLTFAEGRHTLQYRAIDKVGNVEATRTLSLRSDASAPLTALAPSGTLFAGAGGALFAPAGFVYALPAEDPVVGDAASGLAQTRYALDGGAFSVYTATFALSEGVRRVDFQSVDNLGHEEPLKGATVYVDATAPVTTLSVGAPQFASGATLYVSTATPFTLTPQDPLAGGVASGVSETSYRLDGGAFAPYAAPFTLSAPDGARALGWRAADNVGNAEAEKTAGVALDATAPRSALLLVGGRQVPGPGVASVYASSDTRVAFAAEDPMVGGVASGLARILWRDNGGAFSVFALPLALGEGRHALDYQGADNVANLEVARSTTVLVDASAPVTAVSVGAPSFTDAGGVLYVTPLTQVSFAAADPALPSDEAGSGVERVEAAVDGGAFTAVSSPLTFSEGPHTLRYRAQDRVGNSEAERALAPRSDGTPPVSALVIGEPSLALADGSVLVNSLTLLSITAEDPAAAGVASGVRETLYRVAGGTAPFAAYTAAFSLSGADGPLALEFYSRDQVLNAESARSRALRLDATAPQAAISSPHGEGGICSVVSGRVAVRGTAQDVNFSHYRLEAAPGHGASSGFVLVSSGSAAVEAGLLGTWDARALTGRQTLRLSVVDQVGNASVATLDVFVGDPGRLLVLGDHEMFNMPSGVAVGEQGRIYVADTDDDQVQVFTSTGAPLASFGRGHGHHENKGSTLRLNKPKGVAVDAEGALFVADTHNDRILKLSATGQILLELGRRKAQKKDEEEDHGWRPGKGPGEFRQPSGVALDAAGHIYVADTGNNRVQKLSPDGTFLLAFELPPVPADGEREEEDGDCEKPELGRPMGIALDGAGRIYVADSSGARALVYGPAGGLLMTMPVTWPDKEGVLQPGRPEGIAVTADGRCVLVSDRKSSRILRFDAEGALALAFGEPGKIRDGKPLPKRLLLRKPAGLALDAAGKLYVADRNNDRIQVFGAPTDEATMVVPPPSAAHDDEHVARDVVEKEEGGEVEREDRAGVSIPAGALAQDLKITVSAPDREGEKDRERDRDDRNLKVVSAPVEFSPHGTSFKEPVTLVLPYTAELIAAQDVDEGSLKVHYWNDDKKAWEALKSEVDKKSGTVKAKTPHFSLYQVLGSTGASAAAVPLAADASFGFKDQYAFPNPVRGSGPATIRVQPGLADGLTIRVYDVSGRKVHESSHFSDRGAFDDGNGKGAQYTYEHVWDVSGIGSGVYTYVMSAHKAGQRDIHKTGKVGVIK